VHKTVPHHESVIVVCRDEEEFLKLGDRKVLPFLDDMPPDAAGAIEQLEELRDKGYTFVVFPKDAFWCLRGDYRAFAKHLNSHYQRVYADQVCVIYRIEEEKPD
jgi:hypothetical protein